MRSRNRLQTDPYIKAGGEKERETEREKEAKKNKPCYEEQWVKYFTLYFYRYIKTENRNKIKIKNAFQQCNGWMHLCNINNIILCFFYTVLSGHALHPECPNGRKQMTPVTSETTEVIKHNLTLNHLSWLSEFSR